MLTKKTLIALAILVILSAILIQTNNKVEALTRQEVRDQFRCALKRRRAPLSPSGSSTTAAAGASATSAATGASATTPTAATTATTMLGFGP